MATITVDCPYSGVETEVEIPDGAEVKDVTQNYRTGIWGDANKVEVLSESGNHFAVKYKFTDEA